MKPAPEIAPEEAGVPARGGRVAAGSVVVGLVLLLAWMALAPLDEGVPATGQVSLDTKRKPVQHPAGGIVQSVSVREGDRVREGDVLLVLDDAAARASLESLRQRYFAAMALQARLAAERTDAAVVWPQAMRQVAHEPSIAAHMAAQTQVLQARRQAIQTEARALGAAMAGLAGQIEANHRVLQGRQRQLALLEQELEATRPLAAEGYVPRVRLLELERQTTDLRTVLADLEGQRVRAQESRAELEQRKALLLHNQRKEVDTQWAEVTRDLQADADRLRALEAEQQRTTVRAPSAGQVVGLAVQAPGAVVQAGQKLLDVVPWDEPLVLEVRIEPHLVDRIRPDLPTDVRFAGFAHTPQLVAEGRVLTVSGDLLSDPHTAASYYLARVGLTERGREALQGRKLQPGMPVDVVVRTGERSMLTYLLRPLVRRMASSLKEE